MNLFEVADQNGPALADRFKEAKDARSSDDAAILDRFAERVIQDGLVSLNMRPWVFSTLLAKGRYQNIYEWAQEQADLSGRSVDEILHEKLGSYFSGRIAFDACFEQGRRFRYGALNIGGAGPTRYGAFCVVLASGFSQGSGPVAYLMRDSLNDYVDVNGNVDTEGIRLDAALHGSRHHLTALKHSDTVLSVAEHGWPSLVCSDSGYIEAIFLADVTRQEIDEARIPEQEYQRLRALAFDDFSRCLDEGERALVQDFVDILRAARDDTIILRRV